MSCARLALRLAAFEALCPEATVETGPWPTMAAWRVFDSRIDLIQADDQVAKLENKPLLVVYTEQDEVTPYPGAKEAGDQVVVLVVEAMIAVKGTLDIEGEDGTVVTVGTIEAPITDRQHEALLDILEAQVRRILDRKSMAPSAGLYAKVALETRRIESFPQRAADRVTRVAARTMRFHVKVKPEAWPAVAVTPAPTGLAALPEPLRTVALGLPEASTALAVCLQAVEFIQPAAALTPLAGIDITTDVDRDPQNKMPTQVFSEAATPSETKE